MNDQDLTDLFAGMAIQGLLAADTRTPLVSELAEYAYDIAEAMVEERASRTKDQGPRLRDHGHQKVHPQIQKSRRINT
jgi:hypothetical protein